MIRNVVIVWVVIFDEVRSGEDVTTDYGHTRYIVSAYDEDSKRSRRNWKICVDSWKIREKQNSKANVNLKRTKIIKWLSTWCEDSDARNGLLHKREKRNDTSEDKSLNTKLRYLIWERCTI